jgi:RNA polymerase sigma factor (sigma-70 family)
MLRELTDKELWGRIKDNDKEALTQLFKRYYFFLVKTGISYVQDPELAKDAANDLFFNLWRSRTTLSDVDNVRAYLSTAFRNQVFLLARRDLQNKDHLQQWQQTEDSREASYEEIIVSQQIKEAQKENLHRALEQLTPRQKEYLRLKFYEGLTYEEIAEKTGQTVKTIYNTTYEALKLLRREVQL